MSPNQLALLGYKFSSAAQRIILKASIYRPIKTNQIYLCHVESDQANNHTVREQLEKDDGTKNILNLSCETTNQCNSLLRTKLNYLC